MIKSMTGYGGAKGSAEGLSLSIELKSVNNRYLDVSVKLPRSFLFAEELIKAAVGRAYQPRQSGRFRLGGQLGLG